MKARLQNSLQSIVLSQEEKAVNSIVTDAMAGLRITSSYDNKQLHEIERQSKEVLSSFCRDSLEIGAHRLDAPIRSAIVEIMHRSLQANGGVSVEDRENAGGLAGIYEINAFREDICLTRMTENALRRAKAAPDAISIGGGHRSSHKNEQELFNVTREVLRYAVRTYHTLRIGDQDRPLFLPDRADVIPELEHELVAMLKYLDREQKLTAHLVRCSGAVNLANKICNLPPIAKAIPIAVAVPATAEQYIVPIVAIPSPGHVHNMQRRGFRPVNPVYTPLNVNSRVQHGAEMPLYRPVAHSWQQRVAQEGHIVQPGSDMLYIHSQSSGSNRNRNAHSASM